MMSEQKKPSFARAATGWYRLIGPLTIVAVLTLGIGLTIPIMTVQKWIYQNNFSILTGIQGLYQEQNYLLAIIITAFSVIFPILKNVFLLFAWYSPDWSCTTTKRWLHRMEVLGKWSMLDVFVIANLVVTAKLGVLASVTLHSGIYIFTGSIILSIIVASRMSALYKYLSDR